MNSITSKVSFVISVRYELEQLQESETCTFHYRKELGCKLALRDGV